MGDLDARLRERLIRGEDDVILAVLDLHYANEVGNCEQCWSSYSYFEYPCDTVKAIADALGVTP